MLVLSRKAGESVVIDNCVTITITKISGNRVTLGIKAPEEVRILRGELQEIEILPSAQPAPANAEAEVRATA